MVAPRRLARKGRLHRGGPRKVRKVLPAGKVPGRLYPSRALAGRQAMGLAPRYAGNVSSKANVSGRPLPNPPPMNRRLPGHAVGAIFPRRGVIARQRTRYLKPTLTSSDGSVAVAE